MAGLYQFRLILLLVELWCYTAKMESLSIYLHIPFCQHRCGYCDFNTYAGIDHLIPAYVGALQQEITSLANGLQQASKPDVGTVYFGGGTPSLLPSSLIGNILDTINDVFTLIPGCEITLETNPGTISKDELSATYSLGVNRLSIGVQSTNPNELKMLERLHGFSDASRTVENARNVGYDNISLDLIYGLPGQQPTIWEKSLRDVLGLQPNHLSLYALTVEEGTPLEKKVMAGEVLATDPDLAADLYDLSRDILNAEGYVHYEISNWARLQPDGSLMVSRHNRQYWLNEPYIGFGAGAHSFFNGFRTVNVASPFKYVKNLMQQPSLGNYPFSPVTLEQTPIDNYREMQETMFMGLRLLIEGISEERFLNRFGKDMKDVFNREIGKLLNLDLVKWGGANNHSLLLKEKAYLLANRVFLEFI